MVIPLYNEGSHLRELGIGSEEGIATTGCRFEIVVVDDGSTDDTWARIEDEARDCSELARHPAEQKFRKRVGALRRLGTCPGRGDIVMDGDGQHPPSLLPL